MAGSEGEYIYFVTSPNMETSRKLAQVVVGEKIAACVNIIPNITSIFWWKGQIEESTENLLIIKTTAPNGEKLKVAIQNNHPYETPECVGFPIRDGLEKNLAWIHDSVE
ncbi:MAG TPA: divalent-cation tolerance protein CutA [Candidatus Lokiarchaeia archaeon]|nr:divalent-cation tolerance protein CutA [Candidatus Lokiarchaeia archaeon]